jgi:UDP-N-acetylmuramate dehydrogenase
MSIINQLPQVRGKYRENADLSKMCWFGVGGPAEILFQPYDLKDLVFFLQNKPKEIPCFIFGVGSNLLIRDGGIKGIVIRLGRGFNYISHNNHNIITGAASLDINVAKYAQQNGIGGVEFLSGIPGTIGGALAMNAGAYKKEIKDILIQAKAVNLNGEVVDFTAQELGYVYRGHSLKEPWIFVEAEIKGGLEDPELIKVKIDAIQAQRLATQPIRSKTCGSTFKNLPGIKVWELIDKAGCRGYSIGGAQVSEKHCNFFINTGTATAQDLEKLIQDVKHKVLQRSGVELKEEIIIVGSTCEKN